MSIIPMGPFRARFLDIAQPGRFGNFGGVFEFASEQEREGFVRAHAAYCAQRHIRPADVPVRLREPNQYAPHGAFSASSRYQPQVVGPLPDPGDLCWVAIQFKAAQDRGCTYVNLRQISRYTPPEEENNNDPGPYDPDDDPFGAE